MPDLMLLLAIGVVVLLGMVVQSSVGLGVALMAVPVVTLLDPGLMPGSMLVVSATAPLLTLPSEWRRIDWRGLGWAMTARVLGTVVGVWVVAVLSPRTLSAAVGVMVLLAVALSLWAVRIRITPAALSVAGVVSGITGTATSIGGPPLAVVYQHEPGPTVRATLGAYFLGGAALSLLGLWVGGQLHGHQLRAGAAFLPFMVAGYLLGLPLRRFLDAGRMRVALLAVVTVSGVTLVTRSLL